MSRVARATCQCLLISVTAPQKADGENPSEGSRQQPCCYNRSLLQQNRHKADKLNKLRCLPFCPLSEQSGLGASRSRDGTAPSAASMSPPCYSTATASFGQSSICTRAISLYLLPSGLKIDASPSFTSNQSLPRASMMLGLCVMRKVFLPFSGTRASMLRSVAARRLFSSGDTTRPPSVRSVVFLTSLNPARTAVSKARWKLLV